MSTVSPDWTTRCFRMPDLVVKSEWKNRLVDSHMETRSVRDANYDLN